MAMSLAARRRGRVAGDDRVIEGRLVHAEAAVVDAAALLGRRVAVIVQASMSAVPWLATPPPSEAVLAPWLAKLPTIVQSVTVAVPQLYRPPPPDWSIARDRVVGHDQDGLVLERAVGDAGAAAAGRGVIADRAIGHGRRAAVVKPGTGIGRAAAEVQPVKLTRAAELIESRSPPKMKPEPPLIVVPLMSRVPAWLNTAAPLPESPVERAPVHLEQTRVVQPAAAAEGGIAAHRAVGHRDRPP